MNDLGSVLSGPAAALGFGGVAGAVVGYTAKKAAKIVAIALGAVFILLQVLVYKGLISVDWGAVQGTAEAVWKDPGGRTLADQAWDVISANLPFGGGFAAGFALGFKIG